MYIDIYTVRCFDVKCDVKGECILWVDRNNPNARCRANTLRHGNEYNNDLGATPSKGIR